MKIWFWKGRKHFGKMKKKKCWLPAFSTFPTTFLKAVCFRVIKGRDCVEKSKLFTSLRKIILKTLWEKDTMLVTIIFTFSQTVFFPKQISVLQYHKCCCLYGFKLDQSTILSICKGLKYQ